MKTLGLVACCKEKSPCAQAAQTLYRSPLFLKSLAVAKKQCDAVAILSARYGLVMLDQRIQPYDETLKDLGRGLLSAWRASTSRQIETAFPGWKIIYYAGSLYQHCLPPGEDPMKGLTIGKRLQWLDEQMKGKRLI